MYCGYSLAILMVLEKPRVRSIFPGGKIGNKKCFATRTGNFSKSLVHLIPCSIDSGYLSA
jgi:hypothetical protein